MVRNNIKVTFDTYEFDWCDLINISDKISKIMKDNGYDNVKIKVLKEDNLDEE